MAIGKLDHLPHAEADLIANQGQLVDESNVNVARGILDER
jgi:hypothetical protein